MDKVKIHKLEQRGDGIKGKVYNWDFGGLNFTEMPIFYRKAGIKPEGHYHTGEDKSCNPQYVMIIKGKVKFNIEYLDRTKEELILNEGEILEIPRLVYHEYETLEETIFAEPRLTKYTEPNDKKNYQDFQGE